MAVQTMPAALAGERPLSTQEKLQRSDATACINRTGKRTLCDSHAHVGIFFDGTNNNREQDTPKLSHTNIAVLSNAYRNEPTNGYFNFYVPGVGTPFPEIGEPGESADGKSQGAGGDARINWALIRVLNAMYFSIFGRSMPQFEGDKIKAICTTAPLHDRMLNTAANLIGKKRYFTSSGLLMQLEAALKSKPPKKLTLVNLSVFGFSRGAAQARAFCHFLQHILLRTADGGKTYTLAGVPCRIQFLGPFDSVASVGMADSSPLWRGLGGWANGTQEIVPCVERTVHLCAAHEIRINFPLSTVRIGDSPVYPANALEKVYPGAHSDVGGGYAPKDQGKAVRGRACLLSQMPLNDMYNEARASVVPLMSLDELRKGQKDAVIADLKIDPECATLFNAYLTWSAAAAGPTIEEMLNSHMQFYWRWRIKHLDDMATLPSYARASRQDQVDLWESNGDFSSDVKQALGLHQLREEREHQRKAMGTGPTHQPAVATLSLARRGFVVVLERFKGQEGSTVPALVDRFFDEMMHDSHASFYMVGPATEADRKEKIASIQRKLEANRILLQNQQVYTKGLPGKTQVYKPVQFTVDDVRWTLSDLERRIYDHQKGVPLQDQKDYPLLSDADREQLLAMESMFTSGVVRVLTKNTRREWGGHVRYRRVFDVSGGPDSLADIQALVNLPDPVEQAKVAEAKRVKQAAKDADDAKAKKLRKDRLDAVEYARTVSR